MIRVAVHGCNGTLTFINVDEDRRYARRTLIGRDHILSFGADSVEFKRSCLARSRYGTCAAFIRCSADSCGHAAIPGEDARCRIRAAWQTQQTGVRSGSVGAVTACGSCGNKHVDLRRDAVCLRRLHPQRGRRVGSFHCKGEGRKHSDKHCQRQSQRNPSFFHLISPHNSSQAMNTCNTNFSIIVCNYYCISATLLYHE